MTTGIPRPLMMHKTAASENTVPSPLRSAQMAACQHEAAALVAILAATSRPAPNTTRDIGDRAVRLGELVGAEFAYRRRLWPSRWAIKECIDRLLGSFKEARSISGIVLFRPRNLWQRKSPFYGSNFHSIPEVAPNHRVGSSRPGGAGGTIGASVVAKVRANN